MIWAELKCIGSSRGGRGERERDGALEDAGLNGRLTLIVMFETWGGSGSVHAAYGGAVMAATTRRFPLNAENFFDLLSDCSVSKSVYFMKLVTLRISKVI